MQFFPRGDIGRVLPTDAQAEHPAPPPRLTQWPVLITSLKIGRNVLQRQQSMGETVTPLVCAGMYLLSLLCLRRRTNSDDEDDIVTATMSPI